MSGPVLRQKTRNSDADQAPAWAKALNEETIAAFKGELSSAIEKLDRKFTDLLKPIQDENSALREDVDGLRADVDKLRETVSLQQGMIEYLRSTTKSNKNRQIRMESYSMRENIIISGIPETTNETESDLRSTLTDLFTNDMSAEMSDVTIVRCHRLRKSAAETGPRKVIVRFSTHPGKKAIMKCARKLKDHDPPIFINDQLPAELNSHRGTLRPVMQLGINNGKKCTLVQEKLLVDGKLYTVDNVRDVPFDISDVGTERTDEYVMFSGRLSPFSNFYTQPKLFTLDDMSFCSSEQYFQYHKAMIHEDYAVAAEILDSTDPVAIKHAGDRVKVGDDWVKRAPEVMKTGVLAKFSQNPDLSKILVDSGSRSIQESNRHDEFWGTGVSLKDAKDRDDHSQFNGKNLMGRILEDIREQLK